MNKLLNRCCLYFKRNSSTVISCAAVAGLAATVVSAVTATSKAVKILKKEAYLKGDNLTIKETVKAVGFIYIPTAVIAVSTAACILSVDILNRRKQACFVSAYSLLDSLFKNYRNEVKKLYGEEADKRIVKSIIQGNYTEEITVDSDGTVLFYDLYSDRYFRSTLEDVIAAEYHLNRNFALRGYADLNELYEFLDLEKTSAGAVLGWSIDIGLLFYGYQWIDFEHEYTVLDDGLEVYILRMPFEPTVDFMNSEE